MDSILVFVLALSLRKAVPKEELRFSWALEQEGEWSCGLAAAASLLDLYCSIPYDEVGLATHLTACGAARPRGVTLADIAFLCEAAGVRGRAYRMGLGQLEAALAAGFAPAVVHYDRPRGHFALALANVDAPAAGRFVCVADPARGIEALTEGEFLARWSGAALLVDPASIGPEGRGRIAAAVAGCAARVELFARGEAARAAIRAAARRPRSAPSPAAGRAP